jgi:hypothetical protein
MSHMIPPDYVVFVETNYRRQELLQEAQKRSLARQANTSGQPLAIGQFVGHLLSIVTSAYSNKQEKVQPNSAVTKTITQELPITSH